MREPPTISGHTPRITGRKQRDAWLKFLPLAGAAFCIGLSSPAGAQSAAYDYETQTSAHALARTPRVAPFAESQYGGEASRDPVDLSRTIGVEVRPGPRIRRDRTQYENGLEADGSPDPLIDPLPAPR
jgi:hypothetical protein